MKDEAAAIKSTDDAAKAQLGNGTAAFRNVSESVEAAELAAEAADGSAFRSPYLQVRTDCVLNFLILA